MNTTMPNSTINNPLQLELMNAFARFNLTCGGWLGAICLEMLS
jgi:hypothetical protein